MFDAFFGTPLLAVHVGVSLVGIAAGLIAMPALAGGRWLGIWQALFLGTTIATSATGFLFPIGGFTPALAVGAISLAVLAVSVFALLRWRGGRLPGWGYAASATFALYLNLFVLVAQSFQKFPALQDLAPTQSEPPFLIAQSVLFAAMLVLGLAAVRASRRSALLPVGVRAGVG